MKDILNSTILIVLIFTNGLLVLITRDLDVKIRSLEGRVRMLSIHKKGPDEPKREWLPQFLNGEGEIK